MTQLPPGAPFKGKRKGITESGQRLARKVVSEDPSQTPGIDALEHWHPYHLDGTKRRFCAAQIVLNRRSNNQSDVMELGKRCRMRVSDIRYAATLGITVWCKQQNT